MENKSISQKKIESSCITQGVFLNTYSTMKVGGRSRYFIDLKKESLCSEIAEFIYSKKANFFLLGGGSNTVFSDKKFDGLVIKNSLKGIKILKETKNKVYIEVASGESWDKFVAFTVQKNLFGIENLTAIPGTVGGAIVQNIGAYGVEVKESVYGVVVFDLKTRKKEKFKNNQLKFGYRTSVFKQKNFKTKLITSVVFVLEKTKKVNIEYKDLKEYFVLHRKKNISPRDVRKALQEIRSKKFPDLSLYGTAGSFFKNAIVKKAVLENVKQKFPEVVYFNLENGMYKIPTAWLIDKACGLKGYREGDVGLYQNQSLVLVNFGQATAKEIISFKEKIKKIVFKKTEVMIEEEVIVL